MSAETQWAAVMATRALIMVAEHQGSYSASTVVLLGQANDSGYSEGSTMTSLSSPSGKMTLKSGPSSGCDGESDGVASSSPASS